MPSRASRSHASKKISHINKELSKPEINKSLSNTGYEYASQYVEEEERNLIQSSNDDCEIHNFDQVSIGTVRTHAELNTDNLTKIYRTYDFAYRPKNNLTISSAKDEIVSMIETNPVIVLRGPTGCGKTTQVPQFILDYSYKKKEHCNIIVTQPRRIAAISIAKRVSNERNWPLGTLVGYQVGMVNNTSTDTRLTYCTTGVLLQKLINTKHMLDYTHVVLDEVHERDKDMDFLLLVIRKLLWTNSRTVKVILMSATINVDKFSKYFSSPVANQLFPAPIIDIDKKNYYDINKYYLCQLDGLGAIPEVLFEEPKISAKMMEFCARLLIVFDEIDRLDYTNTEQLEDDYNRNVVLIFLPGIWEIEELHSLLVSTKYENVKWDVIILHSSITNEEQQKIFEQHVKGYRRIILSTNIAESSITVPNVKYVIDFCLTKVLITDPITNFQCLELCWASKANCDQRAGRTGRVMDGRVYRLVPKCIYEELFSNEGSPEILRAPLEQLVLKAKLLNMGEPKAILALSLDPPNLANLENTILILKEVGALLNITDTENHFDGELTWLGRIMAQLPVNIHIAKLIALGHAFGVLRSTIIIGAAMSTKSMFNNPFQKKLEAYNAKLRWSDGSWSDCITYLQAYLLWQAEKANRCINNKQSEKNWAYRHFIQLRVLYEIQATINDLTVRLSNIGIVVPMGRDKDCDDHKNALILKVVIAGAFYPNYFISRTSDDQDNEISNVKILGGLDPTTTVYVQGWPLQQPGLLYARRFQDIFKNCCNDSLRKIRVSFDASTRVYITFPQSSTSMLHGVTFNDPNAEASIPSRVPMAVYKALKMRKTRVPIVIPVLNDKDSEIMANELGLYKNGPKMILSPNEQSKEIHKRSIRPVLPALDVSYIPITIRNFIDPGHFWVTLNDNETVKKMTYIQRCTNDLSIMQEMSKKPVIGALVLVPHRMNGILKYYRGIVENCFLQNNEQSARLLLIDYGIKTEARISDLMQFKDIKMLANIPALAFECVLANIHPSISQGHGGLWHKDTCILIQNLLLKQTKLFGEVYSVVNNVVSLTLYYVNGKNKINFNQYLIKEGYATYRLESYLSRQNNQVREHYAQMTVNQRAFYEESQYDSDYLTRMYPSAPPIIDCHETVQLKGPFSPLEIDLVHLLTAGQGKRITIDNSSVNSVLLDPNPEETHECLIVAGSVSQNISGTQLSLRETTLMPNIPGLTALLSLIFAPRVELKLNELGNRYAGALCGLGCHPVTKHPLFVDHDMEVKFNVEITNDDLLQINMLRYYMCVGLQLSENNGDDIEKIPIIQEKCREFLMKILEKKRNLQRLEKPINHGTWGSCDESIVMKPHLTEMIANNVYPLHFALLLNNVSPEYETMVNHLQDLKNMATDDIKNKSIQISCKLCQVSVFGINNLRIHLYSPVHKKNEIELQDQHIMNVLHKD